MQFVYMPASLLVSIPVSSVALTQATQWPDTQLSSIAKQCVAGLLPLWPSSGFLRQAGTLPCGCDTGLTHSVMWAFTRAIAVSTINTGRAFHVGRFIAELQSQRVTSFSAHCQTSRVSQWLDHAVARVKAAVMCTVVCQSFEGKALSHRQHKFWAGQVAFRLASAATTLGSGGSHTHTCVCVF